MQKIEFCTTYSVYIQIWCLEITIFLERTINLQVSKVLREVSQQQSNDFLSHDGFHHLEPMKRQAWGFYVLFCFVYLFGFFGGCAKGFVCFFKVNLKCLALGIYWISFNVLFVLGVEHANYYPGLRMQVNLNEGDDDAIMQQKKTLTCFLQDLPAKEWENKRKISLGTSIIMLLDFNCICIYFYYRISKLFFLSSSKLIIH